MVPRLGLQVVALTLLAGCGGRSSLGIDAAAPDTRVQTQDTRASFKDLPLHRPTCGGYCMKTCPAVSGSKICLQGQVFDAPALMAYWAGHKALYEIRHDACITTAKHGAVIKIFDPIDFVSNPLGSTPLAQVDIDDDGCFVAEGLTIPFTGFFAVAVDDGLTGSTAWALAALTETPTVGMNSENLLVPAVAEQVAADWGHGFLTDGTMLMVFKDRFTNKGREGVVPTFDGKPPVGAPGGWTFQNTEMEVYYAAADPTDAKAIVDSTTSKTTRSGIVFVRRAEVKPFSGQKLGCTIEGPMLGGSAPGTLLFRTFDVEGC